MGKTCPTKKPARTFRTATRPFPAGNTPEAGLGGDTNRATLVERRRTRALPTMTKHDVADAIFERVLELRLIAKMRSLAAAEAKEPRVRRVPKPRRSAKRAKS